MGSLFGATRQAVLRLLYGHAESRFYQRQIIRDLALGSGTVQRELEQLTEAGVLRRTVEGRQTYYAANPQCPVFAELRALVRKTFGVVDVLRQALEPLAGRIELAFVFGSVAEGTEQAGSDIDVMVVGAGLRTEDVTDAFADAQRSLQREINPALYPPDEFCRKLTEGHPFISRVAREGTRLYLIGDDGKLRRMVEAWVAQGAPKQPRGNRRAVRRGGPGSGRVPNPRAAH